MPTTTPFFRRVLPALLLASLALASCGGKDCDPRPKHKKECDKDKDAPTTSTTKPGGAS